MADFPALPLWTDAFMADTMHLSGEEIGVYMLLLMTAWRRPDCDLPDDDKFLARVARVGGKKWVHMRPVMAAFHQIEGGRWVQKRLRLEREYVEGRRRQQRDNANARWHPESGPETPGPDAPKTSQPDLLDKDRLPGSVNGERDKFPERHEANQSTSNNSNNLANATAMPNACQTHAPIPIPIKKKESVQRGSASPPPGAAAEHTMSADGFEAWRKACRRTIPKGWSQPVALKRWLRLPFQPVETMIAAWDAYIASNAEKSKTSRFPQKTHHPENWFRDRIYQSFLDEIAEQQQHQQQTAAKRQAALQRFHPNGPAIIAKVGEGKFDSWLLDAVFTITAPQQATLAMAKPFAKKYLTENPQIRLAIEEVTNTSITITGPSLPAAAAAG